MISVNVPYVKQIKPAARFDPDDGLVVEGGMYQSGFHLSARLI